MNSLKKSWTIIIPTKFPLWSFFCGVMALFFTVFLGCGYRSIHKVASTQDYRLQIEPPNPAHIDEPSLSSYLVSELHRHLARAGWNISIWRKNDAPIILKCNIVSLENQTSPVVSSHGRLASQPMQLNLEFVLIDKATQKNLWRSGLIQVQQSWFIEEENIFASDLSKQRMVQALAAKAAQLLADLLEFEMRAKD